MNAKQFNEMVTHQSGLLGISETSPDMHDLMERESKDERAADAIASFCYNVRKWIGAFAAALAGLDTLVFAGGIGKSRRKCGPGSATVLVFWGSNLINNRAQPAPP